MTKTRVRFAPSPTGDLHLGGARTALYNWLFARQQGGQFLLRIENSDRVRSTDESTRIILEGLRWLGLPWDEEIVYQHQRQQLYRETVNRLIASEQAYFCVCRPEELQHRRDQARQQGRTVIYDRRCREKKIPIGTPGAALRFRGPSTGSTVVQDIIRGPVAFRHEEIEDFVIVRADGSPTYNLCVVADDAAMGITHVIRGDDHLANTPKQILLYQALDVNVPRFAHLPMILGPDKNRLSKRHGATSLLVYRDQGFLPQGLVNALARLGWGYGNQEIFTLNELISLFSLEAVNKSPAVFDADKLLWFNAQHMKLTPLPKLVEAIQPFLPEKQILPAAPASEVLVSSLVERSRTLPELVNGMRFYFTEPSQYDTTGVKKFFRPDRLKHLAALAAILQTLPFDSPHSLEKTICAWLETQELNLGAIAQPLRLALTGSTRSPGIFDVLYTLGKEQSLKRLYKVIKEK